MRAGLVRDQLADAVAEGVAHVQHPTDVADRRARGQGAKGDDLADRFLAVLELDVVDHAVAVGLAEVDVEVGHGHPLRIQEPLEQQLVLQRVQVGDAERIGHQRTGAGSSSWPDRAAVVLGPVDEVAHDQEVAREAHLKDGGDLEFEAFPIARPLFFAHCCVGVQVAQPLPQPFVRGMAEILLRRHLAAVHQRRGEVRQLRLAQHQRQAAALGDLHRIGQRRGDVREPLLHLRRGLEILLAREATHAPRIAEDFAIGDTHPRLVRLVVVGRGELHRMGRHHRQAQPCGQLHRRADMPRVIVTSGALQLDVEAVRKRAGQLQRELMGPCVVAM